MKPRVICFILTSPIHYSRNLLILQELNKLPDVELHVAVGGSALLPQYTTMYGNVSDFLRRDGITNIHEVFFYLDGDRVISKSKTCGLGMIEFSSLFDKIKPDIVVVRGDRFEVLAAAVAAAYMNIPVAHIEGGESSGTIDESVRHAITKMSHIHFAISESAKERVLQMGEDPKYVFNFGSPDIEVVRKFSQNNEVVSADTGSGYQIDLNKQYLIVMFHPVTSEIDKMTEHTKTLLSAIHQIGIPTVWFWPNVDAGAEKISHELRKFRDENDDSKIKFMRYLPPDKFFSLLSRATCLVGNSSAGIKECSYLGIPAVSIGTRQDGRIHAENVVNSGYDVAEIVNALKKQVAKGRYPASDLYLGDSTSAKIAKTLAEVDLYVQKKFVDLD